MYNIYSLTTPQAAANLCFYAFDSFFAKNSPIIYVCRVYMNIFVYTIVYMHICEYGCVVYVCVFLIWNYVYNNIYVKGNI